MSNEILDEIWMLAKPKDNNGAWRHDIWPVIRTSRGDLDRAWNTAMSKKSDIYKENTLNLIKLALPVIAKQRKGEQRTGKMPQPVGIGRFIRDKRWIGCCDEREETKKSANSTKCTAAGCPNETHGPLFDKCTDHLARMYG